MLDIGDVNDTPPQFTQSEYWVTIAEHSMEGTLIVETKATDADMVGMPNVTFSFLVIYFVVAIAIFISNTHCNTHNAFCSRQQLNRFRCFIILSLRIAIKI